MRTLIVNADDFGLSPGVSRGIAESVDRGIVTSTSLMVNMPGLGTAVRLAQARERLSVGLHFNLTYGSPLSERQDVPSLVGPGGRFVPVADPAAAGWSVADIRRELLRQLNAYQRTGLPLTHVDAHQFIDGHDGVFGCLLDLARDAGVSLRSRRREAVRAAGVTTTDHLVSDVYSEGDGQVRLFRHVLGLAPGVTELVCHPGFVDRALRGVSNWTGERLREFWVFTGQTPQRLVEAAGVRLSSFADVDLAAGSPEPERPLFDVGFDAGYNRGYDLGYDAAERSGREAGLQCRWDLFRQTPLAVPELVGRRAVAVVPARNEERTLPILLGQLRRLPLEAIVVVVNGSSDQTHAVAAAAGCVLLDYPFALGHDVGRGAALLDRDADVWLFTDADLVCEAEDLVPFLQAAAGGVDVALNDLTSLVPLEHRTHVVNVAKAFLNSSLGRADLGINSLTAVPHALSRRAVEAIGRATLGVPPLAQARALVGGLQVRAVHTVDAITQNRIHAADSPDRGAKVLEQLILGDHLEAIAWVLQRLGDRGGAADNLRRRDVLGAPDGEGERA